MIADKITGGINSPIPRFMKRGDEFAYLPSVCDGARSNFFSRRSFVMMTAVLCAIFLLLFAAHAQEKSPEIYEKIPQKNTGVSTATALLLDCAPGGGHFYLGDYWRGGIFAGLKLGGGYALYYYYNQWADRGDLYKGADRTRALLGVSSSTPIAGPDGRIRSVDAYKKDYDRSAERMTLSIIGNLVVYGISWVMVYNRCEEINARSVPTFDMSILADDKGPVVCCGLNFRF
jgi:hypothetical protein